MKREPNPFNRRCHTLYLEWTPKTIQVARDISLSQMAHTCKIQHIKPNKPQRVVVVLHDISYFELFEKYCSPYVAGLRNHYSQYKPSILVTFPHQGD